MAASVDTTTLTSVISTLIDDSMDARLTQAQQSDCLVLAKRLRGSLVNLLSVRFNDGTQQVTDANTALAAVNTQVQSMVTSLGSLSQTLTNVTNLVGQLDGLLSLAAKFV